MYHSVVKRAEWIEVKNIHTAPVNMNQVYFQGLRYTFPPVVLQPGSFFPSIPKPLRPSPIWYTCTSFCILPRVVVTNVVLPPSQNPLGHLPFGTLVPASGPSPSCHLGGFSPSLRLYQSFISWIFRGSTLLLPFPVVQFD